MERTNALAWLALGLGVLALPSCGATAPFALLFGYLALRQVNLSDGQLPGARAARAGMVLGALGVVSFLGGLVVVGLYRLRVKSELTGCTNNLRRIGQAVNLYYDVKAHQHYPSGTVRVDGVDPDRRLSWMVPILPYMEVEPTPNPVADKRPVAFHKGEALFARFDLAGGWRDDKNREAAAGVPAWFICPGSAYHATAGEPPLTQYVGIGGFGVEAPTLAKDDPRAGFFGYDRVINRADVRRGTTETMMVTERKDAVGPWSAGGPATVAGVDPARLPFVPTQFGGLHPDGANTLFVDGHARFISDRADALLWEQQSRINVDQ
jgi:prepilin-type processing-associated H-X9-DG protein